MKTNEAEPIAAIDRRVPTLSDTRGKHWILAEVKRLEQEARFLEVNRTSPSFFWSYSSL